MLVVLFLASDVNGQDLRLRQGLLVDKYWLGGEKIPKAEGIKTIRSNELASKVWKQALALEAISGLASVTCLVLIIRNEPINSQLTAFGVSLLFDLVARGKKKQAVSTYNDSYKDQGYLRYQFDLKFTENGIGVVLAF